MSSQVPEGYTIVNRVAQSPHLAREIEKLETVYSPTAVQAVLQSSLTADGVDKLEAIKKLVNSPEFVASVISESPQAAATPMGPGQTEFEKREFKTADGGTVTGAEIVRPEKTVEIEIVDIAAGVSLAKSIGALEQVLQNPNVQAELTKQGYEIDKVSLDKFNDFRDQVIRAFKHFGLDVRQFFN